MDDKTKKPQLKPDEVHMVRMRTDVERKLIFLDFGKPVSWVALSPEEAHGMGAFLVRALKQIETVAAAKAAQEEKTQ